MGLYEDVKRFYHKTRRRWIRFPNNRRPSFNRPENMICRPITLVIEQTMNLTHFFNIIVEIALC